MEKKIAVIRLRGRTGLNADVARTLELLNLGRINNCTVVDERPEITGMIRRAKDYITWGYIDAETMKLLIEKRGEASSSENAVKVEDKAYKPYFRLSPAKGGLGSRGIKATFGKGGALGSRKEKINDMIKLMV